MLPLKDDGEAKGCFACIRARRATGNAAAAPLPVSVISGRKGRGGTFGWIVQVGTHPGLMCSQRHCCYCAVCSQAGILKGRAEISTSLRVSVLLL